MENERFRIIPPDESNKPSLKKHFEIIPPASETPKKRFEIIKPKKTFKILSGNPSTEQVHEKLWFKQENMNDCGPCLLLNAIQALGIENAPRNIEEMRIEINQMRAGAGRRTLNPSEWFTSDDLDHFFIKHGFDVIGFVGDPDDLEDQELIVANVAKNLEEQPFDLIYTTYPSSHYRGVVRTDQSNTYQLLDSFSNGPQVITPEQVNEIISNTLYAPKRHTGQLETLQIIRRKQVQAE